jgi:hypothetical protein
MLFTANSIFPKVCGVGVVEYVPGKKDILAPAKSGLCQLVTKLPHLQISNTHIPNYCL